MIKDVEDFKRNHNCETFLLKRLQNLKEKIRIQKDEVQSAEMLRLRPY